MRGGAPLDKHPGIWALLTIVSFPIVLMASEALGAQGLWPFALATAATLSIFILEAVVSGQLWPFEQGFVERIGHPHTPLRILIFLGATLLILETALIFGVATSRNLDADLLRIIATKQCGAPADAISNRLCAMMDSLAQPIQTGETRTKNELVQFAIRQHAANTWLSHDDLVTCGERVIATAFEADGTVRHAAIVACDSWTVSPSGVVMAKTHTLTTIAASLRATEDGTYTVTSWSEDPQSDAWKTTLSSIASKAQARATSLQILPALEDALRRETYQRVKANLEM